MGFGGKVGKFLIGDKALEFYPDSNVERFIQIPWSEMTSIGANVSGKVISRHFEIYTEKVDSCLHLKILVRFLKLLVNILAMKSCEITDSYANNRQKNFESICQK